MTDEKTQWQGLWKTRKAVYRSQVIKKKDIPPYARLIVRFNKNYHSDTDRPKFVFCFANGKAEQAITLEREIEIGTALVKYDDESGVYYTMDDERLYTYEEVQQAINGATESALRGYTDNIVEDYIL